MEIAMRTIDIALKDLMQIFRDKRAAVFLVALPIVFTLFMGFAAQGSVAPADPRLAVGWVSQDDGPVIAQLHQALLASTSLRLVELGPDQAAAAAQQVAAGKLAAALVVPAQFSQQALAGGQPQMVLVSDPLKVDGQTALQAVQVQVTRLMSAAEIAVLHTGALPAGQVDPAAETATAFSAAAALWNQVTSNGPQIQLEKAQGTAAASFLGGNPYNQSSPGILVMFAVFGLINSANLLVVERKSRTLERMITTSLSKSGIIAGHLLAIFALAFMQQALLVVFGQLALKVDYLREPLGTLLIMVAVALMTACLGLLIGVLAREENRVVLISMIAMFLIAGLGGAWFPLETTGGAFAAIGKLTPGAWAMTGFQNILIRGLDTSSVLLPAAAMLLYAAVFFGLAAWKFRE
jgi:ABC-2 type transport system permease protein